MMKLVIFVSTVAASKYAWGGKCGIAVNDGVLNSTEYLTALDNAGLKWQYNWKTKPSANVNGTLSYGNVSYLPMVWGDAEYNWTKPQNPKGPMADVLLSFNEPDGDIPRVQSNITADKAVGLWMKDVNKARAQTDGQFKEFVSPACANLLPRRYTNMTDNATWADGSEWMIQFLNKCNNTIGCPETITYLGLHNYDGHCSNDTSTVREWTMGYRIGAYRTLMHEYNSKYGFNIKGLFLTEFAGDALGKSSDCEHQDDQQKWMEIVVPMLLKDPDVVGIAWFAAKFGNKGKIQNDASFYATDKDGKPTLNKLGKKYFELCRKYDPSSYDGPTPTLTPAPTPSSNVTADTTTSSLIV